jgi:hypothetical protein
MTTPTYYYTLPADDPLRGLAWFQDKEWLFDKTRVAIAVPEALLAPGIT